MSDVIETIKARVRIVAQDAINEMAANGFFGVTIAISETGKSITVTVKGEAQPIPLEAGKADYVPTGDGDGDITE